MMTQTETQCSLQLPHFSQTRLMGGTACYFLSFEEASILSIPFVQAVVGFKSEFPVKATDRNTSSEGNYDGETFGALESAFPTVTGRSGAQAADFGDIE